MQILSYVAMLTSNFVSKVVEKVASTQSGQSLIRNLDSLLRKFEKPARYCIDGEDMEREITSAVFWIILSVLVICRVTVSKILTKLNQKPIETEDVVNRIVKWRRALRSIRFVDLRSLEESETDDVSSDSDIRNLTATSTPIQSDKTKKRNRRHNYDDSLDYNPLEELMNRTFSDNDDLDSTFTISRVDDASMNCSSFDQSYLDCVPQSESDINSLYNETSTIVSESDSKRLVEPTKPEEMSFGSTDGYAFVMSRDVSSSSLNENKRTRSDPGNTQTGKESLNQPDDPTDALLSHILHQKNVKTNNRWNGKTSQINKKNSKSANDIRLTGGVSKRKSATKVGHELDNRQAMQKTKSQESIGNKN